LGYRIQLHNTRIPYIKHRHADHFMMKTTEVSFSQIIWTRWIAYA
jgi:hypothetical protein